MGRIQVVSATVVKTITMTNKRRQRHSPEQIVRKIQEADRILAEGGDVAAVLRQLNVTEATYYRWRNQFGGLKAEDAKKLKHLEKQNLQLNRPGVMQGLVTSNM